MILYRKAGILVEECQTKTKLLYLAAAVSDFYLPKQDMSVHKIQSGPQKEDGLVIHLSNVPKILGVLKSACPSCELISFKLETDTEMLDLKVRESFKKYNVDMVVGNILTKRRSEIHLYYKNKVSKEISMQVIEESAPETNFIEEKLISSIGKLLQKYTCNYYIHHQIRKHT
eukprot:TRINITY_DN8556_c0_g1_i3.p2 TRINITY_DN8556_c0_g1~~TRINITY_DN8556_c0_g1_i3.p2  ORF type:complete len:172 (+),score=28.43 TRINITY_DN8556_c0_g1_i3:539-1054(+)